MATDFTIGNYDLGGSKGYTASGDCYNAAMADMQEMFRNGQTPVVDRYTLERIEYVAGKFSDEDRQKIRIQ